MGHLKSVYVCPRDNDALLNDETKPSKWKKKEKTVIQNDQWLWDDYVIVSNRSFPEKLEHGAHLNYGQSNT